MATIPIKEEKLKNKVWISYIKNNYHLAKYKKNKDMNFGGDIYVLDSTKEIAEEMDNKALQFILGDKNLQRDLKKEKELLEDIENQYKEIISKDNNYS